MPLRGRENLTPVGTHGIQGKCGYPCLTPNALLHIAAYSAQEAQDTLKNSLTEASTDGNNVL